MVITIEEFDIATDYTSDDEFSRLFFRLLDSEFVSFVKFDSSRLSSGGLCEKALTLSEALLSEEDDLEGKSLACNKWE